MSSVFCIIRIHVICLGGKRRARSHHGSRWATFVPGEPDGENSNYDIMFSSFTWTSNVFISNYMTLTSLFFLSAGRYRTPRSSWTSSMYTVYTRSLYTLLLNGFGSFWVAQTCHLFLCRAYMALQVKKEKLGFRVDQWVVILLFFSFIKIQSHIFLLYVYILIILSQCTCVAIKMYCSLKMRITQSY